MSKQYQALLKKIISEQRTSIKQGQPLLNSILEKIISVDRGVDILKKSMPDLDERQIKSNFAATDLLYLSLVGELPKNAELGPELQNAYELKHNGLAFKVGKGQQHADFENGLRDHFSIEKMLKDKSYEDIAEESQSIARLFKNKMSSFSRYGISLDAKLNDALIGGIDCHSGFLSGYFERLEDLKKHGEELVFTETGALLLDLKSEKYALVPYSKTGQKKIDKALEESKQYRKRTKSFSDLIDEKSEHRKIVQTVYDFVQKKVSDMPDSMLNPVELSARELGKKYGIGVVYKGFDFEKNKFMPALTFKDIESLDRLLEIMRPCGGYFVGVVKESAPSKRYDGTPESAAQMVKRDRAVRIGAGLGESLPRKACAEKIEQEANAGRYALGLIKINEAEFGAINADFKRYGPMVFEKICNETFYEVPRKKREEYFNIAKDAVLAQAKTFERFEYSIDSNLFVLTQLDFARSMMRYTAAKLKNEEFALGEQKMKFFDSMFRQKAACKPNYLLADPS